MKKYIHTCVHCGSEFDFQKEYSDLEINNFDFIKEIDLYEDCLHKLYSIVRNFIQKNKIKE